METEEQAIKRLGRYYIHIWDGCAPIVSQAIKEFRERWKPYSVSSRQYPIVRLMEECIDPAVTAYTATLPARYSDFLPRASALISQLGLDEKVRWHRFLLRRFLEREDKPTPKNQRFIATAESLIELLWDCACKRPARSKIPGKHPPPLNAQRRQGFCRFCGTLTELASLIEHGNWPRKDGRDVEGLGPKLPKLRLSDRYCTEHRPMLSDGTQNPAYRRAMRSAEKFDEELLRLSKQSAKPERLWADSGDRVVEQYIQGRVTQYSLEFVDKAGLRNQARQMTDRRLTDRKKAIVMMIASGQSKKQVADALGISRQAVFKALARMPDDFRLDEVQ